jgi:hypothetical protein
MIQFLTKNGVVTLESSQECQVVRGIPDATTNSPAYVTQEHWVINPAFPDQRVTVGGKLGEEVKVMLQDLLTNSTDVFAWQPSDMVGVPRGIAEHLLNTYKVKEPFAQKKRHMGPER